MLKICVRNSMEGRFDYMILGYQDFIRRNYCSRAISIRIAGLSIAGFSIAG